MPLSDFRPHNLSPRNQYILFGVLALGIVGLFYYFYLMDKLVEKAALETEVSTLEAEVAQGRAFESRIAAFKQEIAILKDKLQVLRSILPGEKETPIVLRGIQQMAAASNLKILRFTPQPVMPRTFYSDWPILIEVRGNYHALGQFFEKIGQYTRIINVDNIAIKGVEGEESVPWTLSALCTATTFVFQEDQAVAQLDQKTATPASTPGAKKATPPAKK
jgi:type IV pilus assembly protein PilO